jgi:hypothetical protein
MIEGTVLFVKREDLVNHAKDVDIEDLKFTDFKSEKQNSVLKMFASADFVLFTDDDGRGRIFKSRMGKDNIIF